MSQNWTNIITTLAGQALSVGLAAFVFQYFGQFFQKKIEKLDEMERRLHRLECRDELRKELGIKPHNHENN